MQEEIENRTANLAISVTKLTARALISAYLKHRQNAKVRKEKVSARKQAARDAPPRGRQTVRELIGQNQGVSSMEIGKTDFSPEKNQGILSFLRQEMRTHCLRLLKNIWLRS